MYTIKQAASRAGVSVPVLRQWERRYGVVRPARTASGYRTYDDAAIARVRAMRRLVDDGWSPSAAAARIVGLGDTEVHALVAQAPASGGAPGGRGLDGEDLVETFAHAAVRLDQAGLELALDEMFSRGAFEQVAERFLLPALRRLGEAWEAGELDVAGEHAASHAILRRLAVAYQASASPSRDRGVVLVGLPPGARHELGALVFSIAARRAGLPVVYLGADLPVADWLEAATQTDAAAAVVGVVAAADVPAAAALVEALHAARPGMSVAVGGEAAGQADTPGTLVLPHGVSDSVEAVRAAIGASRGGSFAGP